MVMETPSPQCVGREFVRQYYTLLHKAPMYLHRFYSHNSSFVHGGVEKPGEEHPPVTGQADIHKKILSLNFCDCHAKIRQVDSQATVGSAVVVQVTGELSNCGQPMRRFMQTFVLAPQSPKKYYVHNDIFRYQDEVFHDSDGDGENQEEAAGDSEPELMDEQMGGSNGEAPSEGEVPYFTPQPPQPQSNGDVELEEGVESADEPVDKDFAPSPVEPEDIEPELPSAQDTSNTSTEASTDMYSAPVVEAKPVIVTEPQETMEEVPAEVTKPYSWASIISGNKSTGSAPPQVNTAPSQPAPSRPAPPRQQDFPTKSGGGDQAGGQPPQPQRTQRPPRTDRRERDGESRGGDGDDSRVKPRLPDSHQLFVGNLPHSMTEKELKTFFEQYGSVVDVRINRKSAPRDVPNFGFVVFESPDSVQQVLDQKPIIINGEHRLNVEEKKQRVEMSGRPGSGTRAGGRGGMGGPQSRGGGGPGGVMGRGGRVGGPPPRMADNRAASGGGGGGQSRGGFGPRR